MLDDLNLARDEFRGQRVAQGLYILLGKSFTYIGFGRFCLDFHRVLRRQGLLHVFGDLGAGQQVDMCPRGDTSRLMVTDSPARTTRWVNEEVSDLLDNLLSVCGALTMNVAGFLGLPVNRQFSRTQFCLTALSLEAVRDWS